MRPKWEYLQVYQSRDPQADTPVPIWIWRPGASEWEKREPEDGADIFNELGAEGWEMVGMPTVANAVFTYKAATDVWHDRANWVEKTYWFKRQVEP